MDLELSSKHRALQGELREFITMHGHLSPQVGGGRKRPDARALAWQRLLVERGYAGRFIPRRYGGFGAETDLLETFIIASEFARAGINPGIRDVGTSLLAPTLLEVGTEAQRELYVGPTIRGDMVWCQGYSEPGAGSDLASLITRARVEGDEFVINGRKIWTTSAHFADMMILLCRTEPVAGHRGISYLLVPMDAPGVEVHPIRTMTGKASFNEVVLTDVRIPLASIVGARGEGWTVANVTLKHERNLLGSSEKLVGRLRRIETMMTARFRDGRPLMADPGLRDRLLRLQAEVMAVRCHEQSVLSQVLHGEEPGLESLVTKLMGSSVAMRLSAMGVDLLGADGLRYEPRDDGEEDEETIWYGDLMYDLGLFIGGGSAQIQKNIIAERGLGMPREPKLKTETA